jgi:predicted PurR-regulated permease PerM
MVERMIIDISKWIVIILIFFIAFACSLFLIFSHFAVSSQQHNVLNNLSNNSNIEYQDILSNLTNETNWNMIINQMDDNDTCANTKDYNKIKHIGYHPAIHYFGRSFGSTILTTFFTLFGVIADDNLPVNIPEREKENESFFFFKYLLGSRI